MIPQDTISKIFDAADIKDVVSDFVPLKKAGVNYTACCPFHDEKTPLLLYLPVKEFTNALAVMHPVALLIL